MGRAGVAGSVVTVRARRRKLAYATASTVSAMRVPAPAMTPRPTDLYRLPAQTPTATGGTSAAAAKPMTPKARELVRVESVSRATEVCPRPFRVLRGTAATLGAADMVVGAETGPGGALVTGAATYPPALLIPPVGGAAVL